MAAFLLPAQTDISFADGFYFINGEKTFLRGIGYEVGAIPGQLPWEREFDEELLRFDMERIRSAGFNAIRTWAAFTEEELDVISDYDIFIIMGIWIDPAGNFADPAFINQAKNIVEEVLAYSKNFDNIIGYLIMNEPLPETIFAAGYQNAVYLWNELIGIIHADHPGVPVSMANTPNGTYIDPQIFDFSAFNVYIYNPVTVNHTHGYSAYSEYLSQHRIDDAPLIITEFGLSVSPEGPGGWGYGGNSLQEQLEGDLFMLRSAIDGGAGGAFMFNYSDGWWKAGNEYVHDPHAEEWFGLVEYMNVNDKYGTPRPVWDACATYNRAIVTIPCNGGIYTPDMPIEIFPTDTVYAFQVLENGNLLYNSLLNGGHFVDTVSLAGPLNDRQLVFNFFDAAYNVLKSETISVLTGPEPVAMPEISVIPSISVWNGPVIVDVSIEIDHVDPFANSTVLQYATYWHQGFDYGSPYELSLPANLSGFTHNYSEYITEDIPVVTFAAGYDAVYGNFTRRIYDQRTLVYEGYLSADELLPELISNEIMIFPNPARDKINIQVAASDQEDRGYYSLCDLSGHVMMQGKLPQNKCLDVSRLSPGTYIISIFSQEQKASHGTFVRLK